MSPQDATTGRCFLQLGPYQKFVFSALVPWLLVLELLCVRFVHRALARWRGQPFSSSEAYQRTFLALLVATYLPLTTTSIRYLDCRQFGNRQLVASALAIEW